MLIICRPKWMLPPLRQAVVHTCGILQGRTALRYAAAANCTQAIQMLVAKGADVNAKDSKVRQCLVLSKQFLPRLAC